MAYSRKSEILKVYPHIMTLIRDINKNDWWDRDEDSILALFKNDKKFNKEMRNNRIKQVLGDDDFVEERDLLKKFILDMFEIMDDGYV
jgi:hypothetical protein